MFEVYYIRASQEPGVTSTRVSMLIMSMCVSMSMIIV